MATEQTENSTKMLDQQSEQIQQQIYNTFNLEGIEIPCAKQDLYLKEWPERTDMQANQSQ